jgi:hypothetical protein
MTEYRKRRLKSNRALSRFAQKFRQLGNVRRDAASFVAINNFAAERRPDSSSQ